MTRSIPMLASALVALGLAGGAAWAKDKAPAPRRPSCAARAAGSPADPLAEQDFGCATELNLRLMIADPRDLTRGRTPAAPAADLAIGAVQRLRTGQDKALNAPAAPDAAAQPQGPSR